MHADIEQLITQHEHRYTRGRRQLVEVLLNVGRPVTLPEIVAHSPDLASSSAYRNLDVLEQCGVIRRVTGNGEHTHFELAEPLLAHHHHLICVVCGAIVDISLDDEFEELVDKNLTAAAIAAGYTPLHHTLDLHGRCADCQAAQA